MNQFVILLHKLNQCAESDLESGHWDIMLEVEIDGLKQLDTWSIPPQLSLINSDLDSDSDLDLDFCKLNSFSCNAKKLPYHRIAYLDYEGDISNNRGNVKRIDKGLYQKIDKNKFKLSGKLFNGNLIISNDANNPDSCKITFTSATVSLVNDDK
ncbi:MAG: hypothetical protein LBB88_03905 [Planctomycetaceae bacterium]|nr:hypothetical protein [Planctomycetaceae bacterium]